MHLTFKKPHLSIREALPDQDVPDFAVISGLNGAGKSHLLQAIAKGAVQVDRIRRDAILHFEFGSMQSSERLPPLANKGKGEPTPPGPFAWRPMVSHLLTIDKSNPQLFNPFDPKNIEKRKGQLRKAIIEGEYFTEEELAELEGDFGKAIEDFTGQEFQLVSPASFPESDPFTVAVSDIVSTYAQRRAEYRHRALFREKGYGFTDEIADWSDEAYERRFGPPPWTMMSESLARMGLRYAIDEPPITDSRTNHKVRLRDLDQNILVPLSNLSTGEITLLALATSLYSSSSEPGVPFPKLLLLDEPDAGLHPSMVKVLLEVLHSVLFLNHDVKVILTTHSPSTVALAPDACLMRLQRSGSNRLAGVSADNLLRDLTDGVPTLSVKLENRRVLFVESKLDEEIYSTVYDLERRSIAGEISLEFVAAGHVVDGGCGEVRRLVRDLRGRGNLSIFGIVDRDGVSPKSEPGILWARSGYAIENLVLSPVCLAALLMRDGSLNPLDLGLAIRSHVQIEAVDAQILANHVAGKLVPAPAREPAVELVHKGGVGVSVPRWILETRGHDVAESAVSAFPSLNRYGANGLARAVCTTVFRDVPDLIPMDLIELLTRAGQSDPTSGEDDRVLSRH